MRVLLRIAQVVSVEPTDKWEVTTKDGRSFTASIESVDDEGSIILKMADNKLKAYKPLELVSFDCDGAFMSPATLRREADWLYFQHYLEADEVRYMSGIPVSVLSGMQK